MIDLANATADYLLDLLYDVRFPAGSTVEIRTGPRPGAESEASGTLLAVVTLPADPWNPAADGVKTKQGRWQTLAIGAGEAGHYRMRNAGDVDREEGTVTATGGGGDMTFDKLGFAVGQTVTINTFTKTS